VPAEQQQVQIGYDMAGQPMYAPPAVYAYQPAQPYPLQPIKAHPWGAYAGLGCLAVLALGFVVVLVGFLVFGFAILAAVLALTVVALTVCVLVLRGLWRDYQKAS
jgi:hypothetical protein